MPSDNVHLAKAKEYIARGEEFYRKAADEIMAAQEEDPTLGFGRIASRVGKSETWCRDLVRWRTNPLVEGGPFSEAAGKPNRDESGARKVARDNPEDFAAAFKQAPPEAKQQIAKQIADEPAVQRAAARAVPEREPVPIDKRPELEVYRAEAKLVAARRALREFIELVSDVDQPGDDEDILEALTMVGQLVEVARETYVSGKSLDSWAAELLENAK